MGMWLTISVTFEMLWHSHIGIFSRKTRFNRSTRLFTVELLQNSFKALIGEFLNVYADK